MPPLTVDEVTGLRVASAWPTTLLRRADDLI
jgi:hypothetical protein